MGSLEETMAWNNRQYVLGIDIGGTHIRLGMVTPDQELHHFVVEETQTLYGRAGRSPLERLIELVRAYTARVDGKLLAVSMGFPSMVSKDKQVVYSSPNLSAFDNVNVVAPFVRELGVPVFIDNDVNFLLLYEIVQRRLFNAGVVLGFYIGTGFGNAIFVEDRFLSGKHGAAAELGHIPVWNRTETCGCGNRGCIELYASGKRLQELRAQHFPDDEIQEVFVKHRNTVVIQEFLHALAIPIATEINILDPDHVIIGGGVVLMEQFPRADLERYVLQHTRRPYPANGLSFTYAEMNQKAGVLGAAYHAYRQLQNHRKEQMGSRPLS
jgi:allose kinase